MSIKEDAYAEHDRCARRRFLVIEIYDFQQRLVNYSESMSLPIDSGQLSGTLYWNGTDSEGNAVDPGKYLVKVTIVSARDTTCGCNEVIIIKGAAIISWGE
jgi:flagellar hook assembly protein FlgD